MIRVLALVFFLLMLSWSVQARVLTFSWLPNKEQVSGYRIYGSTQSGGPYDLLADVGVPVVTNGRMYWRLYCADQYHFFVIAAYLHLTAIGWNVGHYSNEVALKKLPFPVDDFRCECQ